MVKSGETLTLLDLVNNDYVNKVDPRYLGAGNKINLAPLTVEDEFKRGIPVYPVDSDDVFMVFM